MAITLHTQAGKFSPASHPIHWIVKSDQISNEGFEYLADIYSADDLIMSIPVPKSPPSGYGTLDLAPFMRSYLSHQAGLSFGDTGFTQNNLYEKAYQIQWGEMYAAWKYHDFFYASDHGGRVILSSTTVKHNYVVGQQVNVAQHQPFTNIHIQGAQTVFAVIDPYSIVIDLPFGSSAGAEGGIVRSIDGSPIVHTGVTATTICYALGYSLPHEQFGVEDPDMPSLYEHYVHGEGDDPMLNKRWLIDQPQSFRMREDAQVFLPIRNPEAINYLHQMRISTYDVSGGLVGIYTIDNPFLPEWTKRWMYAAIGPYNLANASYYVVTGATDLMHASVDRMEVNFRSFSADDTMAENLTIKIDRRCPQEQVFNLLFIDKKGAWSTFSFINKHSRRDRIGQRQYGKGDYGRIYTAQGRGTMLYEPADLGSGTFHLSHQKEFTLRSEWLTDSENEYFSQLVASPMIYWMRSPVQGIPVHIEDGEYDLERAGPNTIVRREINIQKAYKEPMVIPAPYILRSVAMASIVVPGGGGDGSQTG